LCTDKNGSKYLIEIQNARVEDFYKRCLNYDSKVYSNEIDQEKNYSNLKEVIKFTITNFEMFPNKKDYISYHKIFDEKTNENDLKDHSFVYIELPKFSKNGENKGIEEWCDFLKNATTYELFYTNNPIIQKYDILKIINLTDIYFIQFLFNEKVFLICQTFNYQIFSTEKK